MNPNDEIREIILHYFYDRNASSTSRYGKRGSAVKISDVKRELKEEHTLSQQQVMSNLTYLIDQGWIKEIEADKSYTTPAGMTVPSKAKWYEITAQGIDRVEGESEFKPQDRYSGINIHAAGSNVITLGNGNVVNVKYATLHKELDNLKEAISTSSAIHEGQKLDVAVDIESIKDQLAKPRPNRMVVGHLWSAVEKAAAVAGLVELVERIRPLIASLVS